MLWIVLLFCIAMTAVLFRLARPATVYNEPRSGAYFIVNNFTGYPALGGRQFRTDKAAIRAFRRYSRREPLMGLSSYEVHQVL